MAIHSILPTGSDAGHDGSIALPPVLLRELQEALRSIRYGAIELVIHNGRIVELERREKVRFDTEVMDQGR